MEAADTAAEAADTAAGAEDTAARAEDTARTAEITAEAVQGEIQEFRDNVTSALGMIRAEMEDLRTLLGASLAEPETEPAEDDLTPEILEEKHAEAEPESEPAPKRFGSDRWFGNR